MHSGSDDWRHRKSQVEWLPELNIVEVVAISLV